MQKNILSIIALFLSIIAISISYFRPQELKLDAFNSIVAILSLLVTTLLGWQIFQVINIDKIRKEISLEKESFNSEKNTMMSLLYFEIAVTYFGNYKDGKAFWVYSFEYNIVKSIFYAVKRNEPTQLEWIENELINYSCPMVGRDQETEKRRKEAISEFTKSELKTISNYEILRRYFE